MLQKKSNPNLAKARFNRNHWKIQSIVSQVTTSNVRAILSMLDSTAFCILFSTSLLLLPTILYIVVSISCDHSSSASMMMLCCFNLFCKQGNDAVFNSQLRGAYFTVFFLFFFSQLLLTHGQLNSLAWSCCWRFGRINSVASHFFMIDKN